MSALNPLSGDAGPLGSRCRDCVWAFSRDDEAQRRCRRRSHDVIDPDWPSCAAFHASLSCLDCGACCRSFQAVPASGTLIDAHPELVTRTHGLLCLKNTDRVCAALAPTPEGQWPCTVYSVRPEVCRTLEAGSQDCLWARRFQGLTP